MPAIHLNNIRTTLLNRPIAKRPGNLVSAGNAALRRKGEKTGKQSSISTLLLAFPFQPCMWDEKTINAAWQQATGMVIDKIKKKHGHSSLPNLVARLNKLSGKLNLNTHRKSLAIVLSPESDRTIYLNFPVKPVVFPGSGNSILDLVSHAQSEPDFYLVKMESDRVKIYDCTSSYQKLILEQKCYNPGRNISQAISMLTRPEDKPVIISGKPDLVKGFRESGYCSNRHLSFPGNISIRKSDTIASLSGRIIKEWPGWHARYMEGLIMEARQTNRFITCADAVCRAFTKKADGLLLMSKYFKRTIQRTKDHPWFSVSLQVFIKELEKFLQRGNKVEITNSGFLKEFGGIVLLKKA